MEPVCMVLTGVVLETAEGDVEIIVLGTDYNHYMFTIGVSKGEVFILYKESKDSYVIYYCDKIE